MICAVYSEQEIWLENIQKLKNVLKENSEDIIISSDLYILFLHNDKKYLFTIRLEPSDSLLERSKGMKQSVNNIARKYIFDVLNEYFNVLKVHMKFKTRTLFTINGLNGLIFALTDETQDDMHRKGINYRDVKIPWEDYAYRFIHMTNNSLKLEKTELVKKIDLEKFDFEKEVNNIVEQQITEESTEERLEE